ncbi:class A beta-lactamase [Thalassotalea sediminis]|uniref:class A beta-lactamase n=1 Tax=Thalassotalea sediminis TaxID=1759089 RepID=UPI0025724246|nr:class A beta-lactamase [Thalassotalea sediminis]
MNVLTNVFTSFFTIILLATSIIFASTFSVHANEIIDSIKTQEQRLKANIGVAVYDIDKDKLWHYNGDTRFPFMSTFKVLACAKLLADVNNGVQSLDTKTVITKDSLIYWSPITKHMIGEKMSLKQACSATMTMSDNTAANIILDGINGPAALTAFLRSIGDDVSRLDRIEPELNNVDKGELRDTTTPKAMAMLLHKILFGDVLTPSSKALLKQWMINNKVTGALLRSVLPQHWSIADRSGSGAYGSRAIAAVVWSETRTPLIITIYLTQTEATLKEQNKAIATIGKTIFSTYHHKS